MNGILLLLADGRFPAGGHAHSGGLEEAVAGGRLENEGDLFLFLAGRLATVGRVDAALAAASWVAAPDVHELAVLDDEAAARCPSPALRKASRAQGRGLLRAARSIWPVPAAGVDDDGDPGGNSLRGSDRLRGGHREQGDDRTGVSDSLRGGHGEQGDDRTGGPGGPTTATWSQLLTAELPDGPMYPVALGAVGKQIGLRAGDVALVAAQASVSGPAWAATRLLGLDPFAVVRCLARLASDVETVASGALALAAAVPAGVTPAAGGGAARLPAFNAPLIEIGAEDHARWEVRLFAS